MVHKWTLRTGRLGRFLSGLPVNIDLQKLKFEMPGLTKCCPDCGAKMHVKNAFTTWVHCTEGLHFSAFIFSIAAFATWVERSHKFVCVTHHNVRFHAVVNAQNHSSSLISAECAVS